jgi:uncharacterized protein (DUF736 family)
MATIGTSRLRQRLHLLDQDTHPQHQGKVSRVREGQRQGDKAPDYRIFSCTTAFGAAWKKTASDSEPEYPSVKLDDPILSAPIYASLVKVDGDESTP